MEPPQQPTLDARTRFLAAARGERTDRPPVWLMRQAGRYLPEYHDVRGSIPFMELVKDVDRSVEISLQPWRRFATDAVIFFCDILVPLEAMGLAVEIGERGPVLPQPIRTRADLARLRPFDPAEETGYVVEILRRLRRELGATTALLGFAGAPYTTASYAIEGGGGSHTLWNVKAMAAHEPEMLHELLATLSDSIARYLRAQIEAGVDAVQLFDTWAGELSPRDYATFAAPYHARVFGQLPAGTPRILYVNGAAPHVEEMARCGADVLSVDWRLDLADARRRAPQRAFQGNVDPCALLGPPSAVREAVRACLAAGGGRGHIMNLGHGVLKVTSPECVAEFVAAVKELGPAGCEGD